MAALALGAVGVWTGTIWLTAHEHPLVDYMKDKLLAATEEDAVISRCWSGKTMRHLKSKFTEYWEQEWAPKTHAMPYQGMYIQPMTVSPSTERGDRSEKYGLQDWISTPAGQVMGSLNQRRPARQILYDMVSEAIDILS